MNNQYLKGAMVAMIQALIICAAIEGLAAYADKSEFSLQWYYIIPASVMSFFAGASVVKKLDKK